MKNWILKLFIVLAFLASVGHTKATSVFPIATNNFVSISGGIAACGSNYLVAFLGNTNICTQLISTNGTLIGMAVTNGHSQGLEFPCVASGTNYLIAWFDTFAQNGYAQIISRIGARVGSKISLAYAPVAVASDGTNFLVVQEDDLDNVYGQFVTNDGAGASFLINSEQEDQSNGAAGVIFGKTNYLVLHMAGYPDMENMNYIVGTFVSPGGSVNTPFQISQMYSEDSDVSIPAVFNGTNFLVAWDWDPPPEIPTQVTNWQVHARIVSPSGTFPDNERILVSGPGNYSFSALAFDGTNYLLGWIDGFAITNLPNIHFQFFNSAVNAVGSQFTPFSALGTNSPMFAINGLVYNGAQYAVAATFGTSRFTNLVFAGFPGAGVYGGFLSPSLPGSLFPAPPRITSFSHDGSLMWTNTPGTNAFILEEASPLAGAWSYAPPPLDLTVSTNATNTVSVSLTSTNTFYRLLQGFGLSAFHGVWIALDGSSTNVGSAYFMSDGNGTITNFGGFNIATPAGIYGLNFNYFTFLINGVYGIQAFAGQFVPSDSIAIVGSATNVSAELLPVENLSLCAGTWTGALDETNDLNGLSDYAITLSVMTNGAGSLSGSFSGTGWMFSLMPTNGAQLGYFKTTLAPTAPYNQIQLAGTLSGNTITGSYQTDTTNDQNGVEGTFTLTR